MLIGSSNGLTWQKQGGQLQISHKSSSRHPPFPSWKRWKITEGFDQSLKIQFRQAEQQNLTSTNSTAPTISSITKIAKPKEGKPDYPIWERNKIKNEMPGAVSISKCSKKSSKSSIATSTLISSTSYFDIEWKTLFRKKNSSNQIVRVTKHSKDQQLMTKPRNGKNCQKKESSTTPRKSNSWPNGTKNWNIWTKLWPVSYTHLTLPTICSV